MSESFVARQNVPEEQTKAKSDVEWATVDSRSTLARNESVDTTDAEAVNLESLLQSESNLLLPLEENATQIHSPPPLPPSHSDEVDSESNFGEFNSNVMLPIPQVKSALLRNKINIDIALSSKKSSDVASIWLHGARALANVRACADPTNHLSSFLGYQDWQKCGGYWDILGYRWNWFKAHTNSIRCMAVDNDESRLATIARDNMLRVWNLDELPLSLEIEISDAVQSDAIVQIGFCPTDSSLLAISSVSNVALWDVRLFDGIRGRGGKENDEDVLLFTSL